jgi:hypothetical protein
MELNELRERIERTLREKADERSAWPDIGMEPRPTVRQQEGERRRVFDARLASLSSGGSVLAKLAARVDDARGRRAQSAASIDEMRRRAETERTHGGSEAWKLGADWLSGTVGGEAPGGVIAMSNELGVRRLHPLPLIDDELDKLQADVAEHAARLQAELDAWDGKAVHASVDATLPAFESSGTARVTNRATTNV